MNPKLSIWTLCNAKLDDFLQYLRLVAFLHRILQFLIKNVIDSIHNFKEQTTFLQSTFNLIISKGKLCPTFFDKNFIFNLAEKKLILLQREGREVKEKNCNEEITIIKNSM